MSFIPAHPISVLTFVGGNPGGRRVCTVTQPYHHRVSDGGRGHSAPYRGGAGWRTLVYTRKPI